MFIRGQNFSVYHFPPEKDYSSSSFFTQVNYNNLYRFEKRDVYRVSCRREADAGNREIVFHFQIALSLFIVSILFGGKNGTKRLHDMAFQFSLRLRRLSDSRKGVTTPKNFIFVNFTLQQLNGEHLSSAILFCKLQLQINHFLPNNITIAIFNTRNFRQLSQFTPIKVN